MLDMRPEDLQESERALLDEVATALREVRGDAENALEEVHEMIEDIEHETESEAAREGAAVSR